MNELPLEFVFERIKASVFGQGLGLREMDEMLDEGEGVRHKMEPGKNRPFNFADFFKITAVTGIDARRLLAQIAAAACIGDDDLSLRAFRKAASLGGERVRFGALQFLAYREMNLGRPAAAARLYEELVLQSFFEIAPRQAKSAINHSLLVSRFLAGELDSSAEPQFAAAVAAVREVMLPRDQVAAVMDFATFLWSLGKAHEASTLLVSELWNVLELEDVDLMRKFAGLWETFELPKDTRLTTLTDRIKAHARNNHG